MRGRCGAAVLERKLRGRAGSQGRVVGSSCMLPVAGGVSSFTGEQREVQVS